MNKSESILYLGKILKENNSQKVIINPPYQKHILETAIAWEEDSDGDFYTRTTNLGSNSSGDVNVTRRIYRSVLSDHEKGIKEKCQESNANYIFVDTTDIISQSEDQQKVRATAIIKSYLTFFSIIGEKEVDFLKEYYKGDFGTDDKKAIQEAGIEKMLQVDYSQLLKENPEKFCEWFEDINSSKQIEIVTENWDFLNDRELDDRVKTLLTDDKYKPMVLEIGRDKLTNE